MHTKEMKLVEKDVGERGRDFFLEELSNGGALSARLKTQLLSNSGGRWSALLPEGADDAIYSFRLGRVDGVAHSDDYLASEFSAINDISVFAFEAPQLRRSEIHVPWLASERLAVLGDTVILCQDGHAGPAAILRSFRIAESAWYGIAIASNAPIKIPVGPVQEVTWSDTDATAIVEGVQCLALRIYDGESFLFWRRDRHS